MLEGSVKGLLRDTLEWFVVWIDGYLTTKGVLVPFLKGKHDS